MLNEAGLQSVIDTVGIRKGKNSPACQTQYQGYLAVPTHKVSSVLKDAEQLLTYLKYV